MTDGTVERVEQSLPTDIDDELMTLTIIVAIVRVLTR
jgi:hypothetical protein